MNKIAWQVIKWEHDGRTNEDAEHIILLSNPVQFNDLFNVVRELYGDETASELTNGTTLHKIKNYMCFEYSGTLQPLIEFKRIGQA